MQKCRDGGSYYTSHPGGRLDSQIERDRLGIWPGNSRTPHIPPPPNLCCKWHPQHYAITQEMATLWAANKIPVGVKAGPHVTASTQPPTLQVSPDRPAILQEPLNLRQESASDASIRELYYSHSTSNSDLLQRRLNAPELYFVFLNVGPTPEAVLRTSGGGGGE